MHILPFLYVINFAGIELVLVPLATVHPLKIVAILVEIIHKHACPSAVFFIFRKSELLVMLSKCILTWSLGALAFSKEEAWPCTC